MEARMLKVQFCSVIAGVVAVSLSAGTVFAQSKDFFQGKKVTVIVSAGAGGGYGLYGQLFAKNFARHIPGKPKVTLQYMGESGGMKASNYLYNVAPRDGTYLGTLRTTAMVAQVLRPSGVKYDTAKFNWIGSMAPMINTIGVWHTAKGKSIATLKKHQVLVGAGGKASELYIQPMILNKLVGTKFKIITGYRGTNDVRQAIERGEVQGTAMAWLIWKAKTPHWLRDNKIVHVVQTGIERLPDLPNVPTMIELAQNEPDRQIMRFLSTPAALGRSVTAPPGVPAKTVAILRRAFMATMKDPIMIADATKRNVIIEPTSGDDIDKLVQKAMNTPKALLERTKSLLEY
jgi:tripartite-type tricarboxylate transporter receptor subunit TctC